MFAPPALPRGHPIARRRRWGYLTASALEASRRPDLLRGSGQLFGYTAHEVRLRPHSKSAIELPRLKSTPARTLRRCATSTAPPKPVLTNLTPPAEPDGPGAPIARSRYESPLISPREAASKPNISPAAGLVSLTTFPEPIETASAASVVQASETTMKVITTCNMPGDNTRLNAVMSDCTARKFKLSATLPLPP